MRARRHVYGGRSLVGRIGIRVVEVIAVATLMIGLIDTLTPGGSQFDLRPATSATTSGR